MNRRKSLISILFIVVMMLNLAVMPAMAKPNTITVTVISETRNSVLGYGVHFVIINDVHGDIRIEKDGARGRVTFTVPAWAYNGQMWTIRVYTPGGSMLAQNFVILNRQLSGSIKITVIN